MYKLENVCNLCVYENKEWYNRRLKTQKFYTYIKGPKIPKNLLRPIIDVFITGNMYNCICPYVSHTYCTFHFKWTEDNKSITVDIDQFNITYRIKKENKEKTLESGYTKRQIRETFTNIGLFMLG
jgi:hypothetical protein